MWPRQACAGYREAAENTEIMGYRIPQGTPIMLPPWAMHHSAANYEQPHRFWPERWLANTISSFDPNRKGILMHMIVTHMLLASTAVRVVKP